MTEEKRRAILDEVARYNQRATLEEDEVTVADYAEVFGCGHQLASQRLKTLASEGVMSMRSNVYDPRTGKVCNAYRLIVSHSEQGKPLEGQGLE